MQRFFIDKEQKNGEIITITGADVHPFIHVRRVSIGDEMVCCDGHGTDYLVHIKEISKDQILCQIKGRMSSHTEPQARVTIAHSLPKREKFEWVLQKATEIGAVSFVPFVSTNTVVKMDKKSVKHKVPRWKKIIKEAAQQAQRSVLPEVISPISFCELLDTISSYKTTLIAYEKSTTGLSATLAESNVQDVLIIIGPEGGFTKEEVDEAIKRGAQDISLGSRTLRTETAPIVLLSCILFQAQDLA